MLLAVHQIDACWVSRTTAQHVHQGYVPAMQVLNALRIGNG